MVGTIVDDVLALFSACGFEVRTDNPRFAILGSTDSAGILVDSVIEHFACKAVTQFTVHDIMASMQAPAAARTSVENVQDVLAALDHLEVVRMAAAGVERRRAAPVQAEGDAAGRCRAQGGDTSDDEAWQIADFPTRLAATTQATQVGTDFILATWPAHIWLQWNPDELEEYPGASEDLTWCASNVHATDVEYVRADLVATTQASTAQAEPSVPEGTTRADIECAIGETEYKYFGDYEMGDDQRDAVEVLVKCAQSILSATSSTDAQAAAEVRHYDKAQAVEAWACIRKNNHSIPDAALDDMRDVLLAAIRSAGDTGGT